MVINTRSDPISGSPGKGQRKLTPEVYLNCVRRGTFHRRKVKRLVGIIIIIYSYRNDGKLKDALCLKS